jgi:very-short-patch-repair endonuclease
VISSFSASRLAALHSESKGVLALERYLDYAERGISALAIDLTDSGGDAESPLEESVLSALRKHGYDVVTQVGTAGYRIDLGIRHPTEAGRFALGVECDGAAYHSSRVARDRDRLRQEVLEHLGWRLYRVWGPAWYRSRPEQERRLLAAVEDAIASTGAPAAKPARVRIERDLIVAPLDGQPSWTVPYRVYDKAVRSYRYPTDPLERSRLVDVVRGILDVEAPIHVELLGRRVAQSWECNATRRVHEAVGQVVRGFAREGHCRLVDNFVWTGGEVLVRVPDPDDQWTERDISFIPPVELDTALERLLTEARVVSADELLTQVARIFGFARTGARIRAVLEESIENLVYVGVAVRGDDGLYRPSGAA